MTCTCIVHVLLELYNGVEEDFHVVLFPSLLLELAAGFW